MPRPRFGTLTLAWTLSALVVAQACTDSQTGTPLQPDWFAAAPGGRGGGGNTSGPAVTAADPAWANRGETGRQVHILGSGFEPGSEVSWQRSGTPSADVIVSAVSFVSSTELVATVDVAVDAELAYYDVVVTRPSDRKSGIGTEMFEVTTAQSLGTLAGNTTWSYSANDAGQVVGYSGNRAFFAEEGPGGWSLTDLGPGAAWDIDPSGSMVVGASGGQPVLWQRNGPGFTTTALPSDAGGSARGIASVGGETIIVGSNKLAAKGKNAIEVPVIWRLVAGSWQRFSLPGGSTGAANDINPLGQIVGGSTLWQPDGIGGYQELSLGTNVGAQRINDAGDLIVGLAGSSAVYWDGSGSSWGPTTLLQNFGGCSSGQEFAMGVNNDRMIVGRTCEGSVWHATLWRSPSAAPEVLGGLGYGKDRSNANAITNAPGLLIAGNSQGPQTQEAAVWPVW
jgi:hypothetical protein